MNRMRFFFITLVIAVVGLASPAVEQAIAFPQDKATKKAPAKKDVKKAKSKAARGDVAKGKEIFIAQCASCHGNLGKGDGVAAVALEPKPRDLSDPKYMAKLTDEYVVKLLKGGGPAVDKSPLMPPLGAAMTEAQLANVIAYVRSLSAEAEKAKKEKKKKVQKAETKSSG